MKRLIYFLKSTKWASRILFLLWIAFSTFANFPNESRLQIVLEFGAVFLIPALIIEVIKNPALKKQIDTASVVSAVGLDGNIKKRPNNVAPLSKNVNSDRYISPRRIAGFILLPLAVVFIIIGISLNTNPVTYNSNNMSPGITFGVIGAILLLSSINDPKTKTELAERKEAKQKRETQAAWEREYAGIYLSVQQIQLLESKIELPIVDTPVFLSQGEYAVYYCAATRQETKTRVVGHTGGYSGATIRVAKGFSIRTGGSSSAPVYGDVSAHYDGKLVITNKRLIFLSEQKGFEVTYNTITAATAYADGLSIQSRNHTYTLIVPKADLAVIAFDAVRSGEIPVTNAKNCGSDEYYVSHYDENIDEVKADDVSSVDGMEGHNFEYFCADLLRKNGFVDVSVTRGSGDQGVDILATKDGIKYAVQCKNYATPLSNTPVQEVAAGKLFYNCHVGVVLTNSTFTPGAISLAQATGVLLWDRNTLAELMKQR